MNAVTAMNRGETRDALLAGVEEIRALLAAQCDAEEQAATLSAASVAALAGAGVLAMKLPRVLGGAEADPVTQFEVIEALARANPAAAWCSMVGATSLGMPGAFLPDAGIARMFPAGRVPRGAIVVMPAGEARAEGDGYRLSGRWSFASGVRHADWLALACRLVAPSGGAPQIWMMVVPAAAAHIHDNWQVAGLKGTGSCDVSVDDCAVPAAMAWNLLEDAPRRGGPLYRLGIPAFVANEHAAFALGVARRALDELVAIAAAKRRGYAPGAASLATRATVQRAIGEGEIRLRAARALAIELNEQAWETVVAGRTPDGRLQSELRAVGTFCTETAVAVAERAFRYAGGAAIYSSHVLQRCLRDLEVAAQHLIISETAYENLAQFMLGFDDADPMR